MKRSFAPFLLSFALIALVTSPALAKPGSARNLGKKPWPGVHGIASIDDKIYVSAGSTLYVADKNGKFIDLMQGKEHEFGNAEQLTAFKGNIVLVSGTVLYQVDKTGKSDILGRGWRYVGGIAGLEDKLYIASNGTLYMLDKTGSPKALGDSWYHVHGMTELDGKLYIVNNQSLFEVDQDGKATQLDGTWDNVLGMTAAHGKLYIYTFEQKPILHEVDKTGKGTPLLPNGVDGKSGITAITALDGTLYMTVGELADSVFFSVDTK